MRIINQKVRLSVVTILSTRIKNRGEHEGEESTIVYYMRPKNGSSNCFSAGDNADETGDIILILGLPDVTRIV